jgi:hypothetical protein
MRTYDHRNVKARSCRCAPLAPVSIVIDWR